jgi:hypothetical protein
MAELQLKAKDQQAKLQQAQQESQADAQQAAQQEVARQEQAKTESADRAADRASRERVAETREETERVKLIGELAQQGHVPPEVALSAATGKPISQTAGLVNHMPQPMVASPPEGQSPDPAAKPQPGTHIHVSHEPPSHE